MGRSNRRVNEGLLRLVTGAAEPVRKRKPRGHAQEGRARGGRSKEATAARLRVAALAGKTEVCELCRKPVEEVRETPCCRRRLCIWGDVFVSRQCCWDRHSRYTLCSAHAANRHKGRWQDCGKCRTSYETEVYVHYGTNRYNLEKLENPPAFAPTHCARCGVVIRLGRDAYASLPDGTYHCGKCWDA